MSRLLLSIRRNPEEAGSNASEGMDVLTRSQSGIEEESMLKDRSKEEQRGPRCPFAFRWCLAGFRRHPRVHIPEQEKEDLQEQGEKLKSYEQLHAEEYPCLWNPKERRKRGG
ncbi:hypothetical protein STEG23_015949 [Scotinomys teguina]